MEYLALGKIMKNEKRHREELLGQDLHKLSIKM